MAVFIWLLVISFLVYCFWKTSRPKHFPPRPWVLPLLGNMTQSSLQYSLVGSEKLAKQYGPVTSVYIGRTPNVFVHDLPSAKEVLLTKGTEFAGRSSNPISELFNKETGIIMAPYGQAWKEQRRFSLMVLRNFGLGKRSMEERILEEASYLNQAFTENMSKVFRGEDRLVGNTCFITLSHYKCQTYVWGFGINEGIGIQQDCRLLFHL